MRPYIYTTPDRNSFLITNDTGEVNWVLDLKGTLDWWISTPWHLEREEACTADQCVHT